MRNDPRKIERWLTQREKPPEITPLENATQAWAKIQTQLQQALHQNYPIANKKPKTESPEWAKAHNNGVQKQNGGNYKITTIQEQSPKCK